MCGCTNSIKSLKKNSLVKNKFLKFKKFKAVKSQNVMDTGAQILIVVAVFAVARLLNKMAFYQKLSATTQSVVDYGAMIVGALLNILGEHPYVKAAGLAASLAAIYNKWGADVDAQVKKIFAIAGFDTAMLRDGLIPNNGGFAVAGPRNNGSYKVACPPVQKF